MAQMGCYLLEDWVHGGAPGRVLVFSFDEDLLFPVGSEAVRHIDQPTTVFRGVSRETHSSAAR